MYCNSSLRNAIAFSVFVKAHTPNCVVKDWSVNKLHEMTGVSANAIKARLGVLESMGLIEKIGIRKNHLLFKSLHSHTAHRNVIISDIKFKPNNNLKKNAYAQEIKNIENVLAAMLLVEIQRHKDFAKQMIQRKVNPRSVKEYKESVKACNRFEFREDKFVDNGISYKYLAAKIGISISKTVEIVKCAVYNNLIKKIHRTYKRYKAYSKYIEDILCNFTFCHNNYIYKILANRYELV